MQLGSDRSPCGGVSDCGDGRIGQTGLKASRREAPSCLGLWVPWVLEILGIRGSVLEGGAGRDGTGSGM